MKKYPKLEIDKIVDILLVLSKEDRFYFKSYVPDILKSYCNEQIQLQKDEFALGFCRWKEDNFYSVTTNQFYPSKTKFEDKTYNREQLLTIYKTL